jgi:MATE family multidrug resistance protein
MTLAVPVVVSQFASNGMTLIGTAVMGRLGTTELATIAYVNALFNLGLMVLVGVMLSVPARVAAAHGAQDPQDVRVTARAGALLGASLALGFGTLLWLGAPLVAQRSPAGLDAGLIQETLRTLALVLPASMGFMTCRGILEATGQPRTVTAALLLGVAASAGLAPALAFGWGPLPTLGFRGPVLSTVLTLWLVFLTLLRFAWPALRPGAALPAGAVRREYRQLLHVGVPIGLTLGAEVGLFGVTSLLMAQFGTETLAAHNVALQIITAAFMVPLGLSTAVGIRVAHLSGRKQPAQARRAGLIGMQLAVGFMLTVSLLYLLAPRAVIGLFVDAHAPANAALVATATGYLLIAALFQAFDGLQVTANAALRGLQDTRVPMLISLASYWLVGLGLGALLAFPLGLGGQGLWFGLTAGLLTSSALLTWRFLHRARPGLPAVT